MGLAISRSVLRVKCWMHVLVQTTSVAMFRLSRGRFHIRTIHLRVRRFGGLDAVPRSRTDGRCGGSQRRFSARPRTGTLINTCPCASTAVTCPPTTARPSRWSTTADRVTAPERATIWRATRTRRILGEKRARTSCTDRSGGRALTGASARRSRAASPRRHQLSRRRGPLVSSHTRRATRPYRVLRLEASARGALSDRVPSCCCSGRPRRPAPAAVPLLVQGS